MRNEVLVGNVTLMEGFRVKSKGFLFRLYYAQAIGGYLESGGGGSLVKHLLATTNARVDWLFIS